jgi:hypothetical protein
LHAGGPVSLSVDERLRAIADAEGVLLFDVEDLYA